MSWSVTWCLTSHTGLGVHSMYLHECTYVAKHDEDIGSTCMVTIILLYQSVNSPCTETRGTD